MKYINYLSLVTVLLLTACSADEQIKEDLSFVGTPIDIRISLDGQEGQTRAVQTMPIGQSAYLTTDHVSIREYYYNESSVLTSPSPLVWTSGNATTIYGYYIDGGLHIPAIDRSYLVTPTTNSYLAGKDIVQYKDNTGTYSSTAQLTLKQQLAKIIITIKAADGTSTITNGQLGGGMIHTSGTFSDIFDANGYGIGGDGYVEGSTDGTGWTVDTRRNPETLELGNPVYDESSKTYSFTVTLMPQIISNTSTPFFTVTVADIFSASYYLSSPVLFQAGKTYNMNVDDVTKTLYITNSIYVEDFTGYDASRVAITATTTATWN